MFCDVFHDCSPRAIQYVVVTPNNRDDESYGERIVNNYEIEYVESGTGYVIVDGKRIPATDKVLMLRQPGMLVEGVGVYQSHFIELAFNEQHSVFDELTVMPLFYFIEDWKSVQTLFEEMFHTYYNDDLMRPLSFKRQIFQLFEWMVQQWYYDTANAYLNHETIENINKSFHYIRTNYEARITLELLASVSGYGVDHFSHVFKQIAGESPVQYINRVRINHARRLLAESLMPTDEVMLKCGFNNYGYFQRSFKKFSGTTPGQYRRLHQGFARTFTTAISGL